ncbi:MAG: hypothetical protein JWP20_1877 [Roseomonas sp.]|nr:hypothetical protein [Roseomonas sp.]
MARILRLVLLLVLAALPASGARAHAALVASDPADGASLARPPDAVMLRFDEAVTLLDLRVTGPAGKVALPAAPKAADGTIQAQLPAGLGDGTYLASFRVISADGHPVAGTLAFGVGVAPEAAAPPETGAVADWVRAAEVLRFLLYLGFTLGAGGALFRALVAAPPGWVRHVMAVATGCGIVAALLGIGAQGGGMLAAFSFTALLQPATWGAAMAAGLSARGFAVAIGLGAVAISAGLPGRAGCWTGALGAVTAAIGLSLSGHAAAGGWLAHALLAGHALVAAYWLGAFLPLLGLLRAGGVAAAPAMRRFAGIALPAVAVLLLTGVAQAALRLPGPMALVRTPYGQLVLAKAACALSLLLLAAWNHRRLTPALATGKPGAARLLARSIGAEAMVGALALGITAVLTMTPPRAAPTDQQAHDHRPAPGAVVVAQAAGLGLALEAEPARAGRNRLLLHVAREDGTPLAAPEVWIELSQAEAGVAALRRRMVAEAPGRYQWDGPELALPGRWAIRAEILVDDFELVTAILHLDVAPGR